MKRQRRSAAFICDLYLSYKKSPKTADELRYIIFCQKKPNSEALPPTSDSLRQHINRANYQMLIWRKNLDALLELLSPKGGKKKMMSWRQSWCPRTRHLPAYWSLRHVPARSKSAAATVLVQMSVFHVQKLAPVAVWRRTRVRTHMEWNGSRRKVIPMTRSEHAQNVYSCGLLSFGTGCRCTIWSVAL